MNLKELYLGEQEGSLCFLYVLLSIILGGMSLSVQSVIALMGLFQASREWR